MKRYQKTRSDIPHKGTSSVFFWQVAGSAGPGIGDHKPLLPGHVIPNGGPVRLGIPKNFRKAGKKSGIFF